MASELIGNIAEKAKNMTGAQNKKVAQLSAHTKDVHDESHRITSDYGVKQNDTDHWLAAVSEDKQGPQLLEDPFGREKVQLVLNLSVAKTDMNRSIVLTMNVSRSESFTHEVLAPLESLL